MTDRQGTPPAGPGSIGVQRLDRWLWFARIVKSRTLAAALVEAGKFKVNKVRVSKPSHAIRPGDVITSTLQRDVRILKVLAPGTRRGPPSEARLLFDDLTPVGALAGAPTGPLARDPAVERGSGFVAPAADGARSAGDGRPTKRDRRLIDRLKGRGL